MQRLSVLSVAVWTACTTIPVVSGFSPRTRGLPRKACHCLAQQAKSSSALRRQTKSYAVTVESATAVASAESSSTDPIVPNVDTETVTTTKPTRYNLNTPAATLSSLIPDFDNLTRAEYEDLMRKVINGIILTISFGSAIYAILNIDSGMTRGWTQSVSTIPSFCSRQKELEKFVPWCERISLVMHSFFAAGNCHAYSSRHVEFL